MTVLLICIAYVANVFLNRWLNKIIVRADKYSDAYVFLWFLPLLGTGFFIGVLLFIALEHAPYYNMKKSKFVNWFTGKHWK